MQSLKVVWIMGSLAFIAWTMAGYAPVASAQGLAEQMAVTEGMNTLNSASTGPNIGGGFNPVQRARDAAEMSGGNAGTFGGAPMLGGAPGAPDASGEKKDTTPKITVLTGYRVFDGITNELLDDPIKKKLPETEKKNYYDDGTHGDLMAGDGEYTKVDGEQREWLGQSTQRVKEHLIQALQVAEGYTLVQFFGNALMTISRQESKPRKQSWKIVPDPKGGPGYVLTEQPATKVNQIPVYRDKVMERDAKIKNDWAFRFLQEYRKNKDSLTSQFYPIYVPMPPQPPAVSPPLGWIPFSDPTSLIRSQQMKIQEMQSEQNTRGGMGMGGMGGMMGGMGGMGGGGGGGGGGMR